MNMELIDNCSEVLGAPKDWPHEKAACLGLPVRYDEVDGIPCVVSAWKPTPFELAKLIAGAPVTLWVCGTTMPPVSLQVGEMPTKAASQETLVEEAV